MADEPEVLKYDPDPAPEGRQRVARCVRQFLAEKPDPPPGGPLGEVEELQQGSLAGPRWAGQEIEGSLAQTEIEVTQNLGAGSVAQTYAVEFDDGRQR